MHRSANTPLTSADQQFRGRESGLDSLEETAHYQVTRGILERPESYWEHLIEQ